MAGGDRAVKESEQVDSEQLAVRVRDARLRRSLRHAVPKDPLVGVQAVDEEVEDRVLSWTVDSLLPGQPTGDHELEHLRSP